MKWLDDLLKEINSAFPDPWLVDGVEQVRPVKQLGFILGVILTAITLLLIR